MTQPAPPGPPLVPLPYPSPIPREGLRELIESLAQVQVRLATSKSGADTLRANGLTRSSIALRFSGYRGKGVDEYRIQYDPATDRLVAQLSGYRIFTVSCLCTSDTTREHPLDVLERVRWGLGTIAAYNVIHDTLKLAIVDYGDIHSFDGPPEEGRTVICGNLDLRFARLSAAIVQDDPADPIEKVNGSPQTPGTPPTIIGELEP